MPRNLLGTCEHVIQALGTRFVSLHMRLMPQSELRTNLARSLVITEQDYLDVRMQNLPACQRVPLNHSVVALERLRCCEKCDHLADLFPKTKHPRAYEHPCGSAGSLRGRQSSASSRVHAIHWFSAFLIQYSSFLRSNGSKSLGRRTAP